MEKYGKIRNNGLCFAIEKGLKGGSLEKRCGTQEVWTPLERYPVFENYKLPKIPPEFGRNSSFNSYLRAKSSI